MDKEDIKTIINFIYMVVIISILALCITYCAESVARWIVLL